MTLEISREPIETLRAKHPHAALIREETLEALAHALERATAEVLLVDGLITIARTLNRIVRDRTTHVIGSGIDGPRLEPLRAILHASHAKRHVIACCGPIGGSRMNEVIGDLLSSTEPIVFTGG